MLSLLFPSSEIPLTGHAFPLYFGSHITQGALNFICWPLPPKGWGLRGTHRSGLTRNEFAFSNVLVPFTFTEFKCMGVLPAHMSMCPVHAWYLQRPENVSQL